MSRTDLLGSTVEALLAAERSRADLFLPLKAALNVIAELGNTWDEAGDAAHEFAALRSKLAAFQINTSTDRPNSVNGNRNNLHVIAEFVRRIARVMGVGISRNTMDEQMIPTVNVGEVKMLLVGLVWLLDMFQAGDSAAVQELLFSRPPLYTVEPRSTNIVNQNSNTTFNVGGYVININPVNNNVFKDDQESATMERTKKINKARKMIKSVLDDNFVSNAADDEQPAYAGCMPGTRVQILHRFMAWVKDDPLAIFWLAGMAGTDKTSIAITLCRMLRKDSAISFGGGYFCSRSAGSVARADVRRILPTLAALLAGKSAEFALALETELLVDSRVAHKPVSDQVDTLLKRPLAALRSSTHPIAFVIDALDECSDERELSELLKVMADFKCEAKVKFILTSRPNMHIRGSPISNPQHNSILHLHTICHDEVTSDIRLYIRDTLEVAAPNATWYTRLDVEALVKLSHGLFIFSSTVLKYILAPEHVKGRGDRLRKATSAISSSSAATASLDHIYEIIIREASRPDHVDADELLNTQRVLAGILTARTSLSVQALADLLDSSVEDLRMSLERLHSVVHIPADDTATGVRALHASLGDYLFGRAASDIRVSASLGNEVLAHGCLSTMAKRLCFDISRSQSSYQQNAAAKPHSVSLSLRYACFQWVYHVAGLPRPSVFDKEINKIFRPRLLFWLEVLSILGQIWPRAAEILHHAAETVELTELSLFLHDAHKFVALSREAIELSAPHIYLSALPFAPQNSLVFQDFVGLVTGVVSIDSGDIIRRLIMTLKGHERAVRAISYSPDGHLLASASVDGSVRVWSTSTGAEAMPSLLIPSVTFWSVAFSPDGKHLVFGTGGGVVCLWVVGTDRSALQFMRGHSGMVRSVTFSPDGQLVASASEDKTVRLWSTGTYQSVSVIDCHAGEVRAVAFSPNGEIFASCSDDETTRLWYTRSCKPATKPIRTHTDYINSLSFSPDGTKLASGSGDGSIHVWEPLAGKDTARLREDRSSAVLSICFSPNGKYLVSGSEDGGLRLWDMATTASIVIGSHSGPVHAVSYSPDGLFIASASRDGAICIWDSGSAGSAIQPRHASADGFLDSMMVSPDNAFIVSTCSKTGSIRVWDMCTGKAKLPPLPGFRRGVTSVSFDAQTLTSTAPERAVRAWDTQTGAVIWESQPTKPISEMREKNQSGSKRQRWNQSTEKQEESLHYKRRRLDEASGSIPHEPEEREEQQESMDESWPVNRGSERTTPMAPTLSRVAQSLIERNPHLLGVDKYTEDVDGSMRSLMRADPMPHFAGYRDHISDRHELRYSPDRQFIVSGVDEVTLHLKKASTGTAVALHGHSGVVRLVMFTPDGQSIVSGDREGQIRVWDVKQACSLLSRVDHDTFVGLAGARLKGGWLVGSADELLLWVPKEYRTYLQVSPCTMVIGRARIIVSFDESTYLCGANWTACWRGVPRIASSSP